MGKYLELIDLLKNQDDCVLFENEEMKKHTSFQIGGCADLFLVVKTSKALKNILELSNEFNIPTFIIGKGSNLLVSDKGIRGLVIKLDGDFSRINISDGNIIECGSGVSVSKLCNFALENCLSGLEFAWGIPGTAGGAVFMNAGAYGGEIKDVILSCSHIAKKSFKEETFNKEQLKLSYRKSVYNNNDYIITGLKLKLCKGEYDEIKSKMDDFMSRRKSKQPLEYPSAGSVFKRPEGNFAGTLIEKCGLKGKSVNGAMVSNKHAGFIVNTGKARCEDVLSLIKIIKSTVKEKTNIDLECEIKIIGEF